MNNDFNFIGRGILNWPSNERVSDRYGVITLFTDEYMEETIPLSIPPHIKRAALLVEIVDTRDSQHIGDLFHGIFPITPDIGERFYLCNTGTVHLHEDGTHLSIIPDDGRDEWWFNPDYLYRSHSQTVDLWLVSEDI